MTVNADTTLTTNVTGTPGADGAVNTDGQAGSFGVFWGQQQVDVVINPDLFVLGGAGGNGGLDTNDLGGNDGGLGGFGLYLTNPSGSVLASSGDFIFGGAGGNGSHGGVLGVADTRGGDGGPGGVGILALAYQQVTLNGTTVTGGNGGIGGAFGDTGAVDDQRGGYGGTGGVGVTAAEGTIITLVNSHLIGGNGGAGGASPVGGATAFGGGGGAGVLIQSPTLNGVSITVDANSSIIGGQPGSPGAGGSGGSPTVGGAGILSLGFDTTITNHGLIQGVSGAVGISLQDNTNLIDNFGTIESEGNWAVLLSGTTQLATLNNHAGASIVGAHGVFVGPAMGVGTFTNDGTIDAAPTGKAIEILGQMNDIVNTGLINGDIIVPSAYNGIGLVNANGVINGDVAFSGAGNHAFSNSGAINGDLTSGAGNDTLDIYGGSINGAVDLAAGFNFLRVFGTFDTDGAIGATGGSLGISVFDGGVITVEDMIGDVGAISVDAGGQLRVAGQVIAGSGALSNLGSVAISGDAQLQAATMVAGGAFVFGINEFSESPRLVLNAGAIDFTGASLQIEAQPSDVMFTNGSAWIIAQGSSAAVGVANGQQLTDNSALLNFFVYRGDALPNPALASEVWVQVQLALLANIAAHGDDPNAGALGGALDTIGLNGNGAIDQLMLLLAQQQTDAEINAILDSLLPETDGVAADIATDAGEQILDVASRRLDGLRGTSVASLPYRVAGLDGAGLRGSRARDGVEVWGQAYGRIVDQRRYSYNEGYDADGYGFAAGADTALDGGASMLGAAFAYGQTNADGNGVNRTATDVDSYQLVLYGDHLFDDRVYANGMLGYGWHANDIARHNVGGPGGATLFASYDAWQFTARAETGRTYQAERNLTLVPHLTASFAFYDPESYSECLAPGEVLLGGPLALNVAPESLQSLRLGLGVLARWDVEIDAGTLFQPELRLNYRRELIGDRFETTSQFVGAPGLASFNTLGVDPARDILDLGIGALLATAGGLDVRASFDLELKDDYTAHGGYVRASVAF